MSSAPIARCLRLRARTVREAAASAALYVYSSKEFCQKCRSLAVSVGALHNNPRDFSAAFEDTSMAVRDLSEHLMSQLQPTFVKACFFCLSV
mmetsp:Transcript_25877/g.72177  ORF Transcript_25877/g.72177 Transcript_25877/m.72177 type:complete len:92 (-) Transcript_25877:115-390(-)